MERIFAVSPRAGFPAGWWNITATGVWFTPLPSHRCHRLWDNGDGDLSGAKLPILQAATAEVSYVLGEFYWRVGVGERCEVVDIAPPLQLSVERTGQEIVWSQADYNGRAESTYRH